MKITSHTVCQNEERYVWYSLRSVVNFVDEMMIWDLGSTDRTLEIINRFKQYYPAKVKIKSLGAVDSWGLTQVRQKMLQETKSDWLIILDADEVWWFDSIKDVTNVIRTKGNKLDMVVTKFTNLVGDIFHYQDESAGFYNIDDKKGHITFRAMNAKIPGLKIINPHGKQAFVDEKGDLLQERVASRRVLLDINAFMHFTNLRRSLSESHDKQVTKRSFKYKYELGNSLPRDFYFPESLFLEKPEIVADPWEKRSLNYILKSAVQTPPKKIKRKLKFLHKHGY